MNPARTQATAADAESPAPDAETTAADTGPTAADTAPTAADTESTAADTAPTAADAETTAADTEPTAADAESTAADAETTAADAETTAADAETKAADAEPTRRHRAAPSGVVLVTGTGTGIGKTMTTAALAAAALARGQRVCVVKPVQTGVGPGEPGDADEVVRLVRQPRLAVHEFVRLPEPLAPQAAARRAGVTLPALARHAERIAALAREADLVLVEGAGGLLVRLDGAGATLADLAALVPVTGAVVVTGAELGTLNLTELTVQALRHRGVPVLGLVIGRWPGDPGVAELGNLQDLPALTGVPLWGLIPDRPELPPVLVAAPPEPHRGVPDVD